MVVVGTWDDTATLVLVILYSVVSLMSLWSLIALYSVSPGFIPLGYEYDAEKLTSTVLALIKFCDKNEETVPKQSDSKLIIERKSF